MEKFNEKQSFNSMVCCQFLLRLHLNGHGWIDVAFCQKIKMNVSISHETAKI